MTTEIHPDKRWMVTQTRRFDKTIAIAELKQCEIKILHHLRRIRVEQDYETAQKFHHELNLLTGKASMTVGKAKRLKLEADK